MNDAETPKKPSLPKWEQEARDSIRSAIRRFNKPLQDIAARDANEGDTRIVVTDFLCTALGYDKFEDLTTEFAVRGEFADYGVRIDKQLVAFIEVKRVAQQQINIALADMIHDGPLDHCLHSQAFLRIRKPV